MKQTKTSVSQLFDANEETQHVIVDSCATATELSHSAAFSAETLPRARTNTPRTKLLDSLPGRWSHRFMCSVAKTLLWPTPRALGPACLFETDAHWCWWRATLNEVAVRGGFDAVETIETIFASFLTFILGCGLVCPRFNVPKTWAEGSSASPKKEKVNMNNNNNVMCHQLASWCEKKSRSYFFLHFASQHAIFLAAVSQRSARILSRTRRAGLSRQIWSQLLRSNHVSKEKPICMFCTGLKAEKSQEMFVWKRS